MAELPDLPAIPKLPDIYASSSGEQTCPTCGDNLRSFFHKTVCGGNEKCTTEFTELYQDKGLLEKRDRGDRVKTLFDRYKVDREKILQSMDVPTLKETESHYVADFEDGVKLFKEKVPTQSNPDILVDVGIKDGKLKVTRIHYPKARFTQEQVSGMLPDIMKRRDHCPLCDRLEAEFKGTLKS